MREILSVTATESTSPQSHKSESPSWTQRLWDRFVVLASPGLSPDPRSLNQCNGKHEPRHNPVWCRAYLRRVARAGHHQAGEGIDLVIQCELERDSSGSDTLKDYQLIGQNTQPFVIPHGRIQVCLKTGCMQADESNGEGQDLCKRWDFTGQATDCQFVLNMKSGFQPEGILGKVVLKTASDVTVGEFNLFFMLEGCEDTGAKATCDDVWLSLGYRELAESLGILGEDSTITDLCHELGFTEHESETIQTSSDPFLCLVTQFRSRQGTPREFIQKIYQCKRRSYVNPFVNGCDGEPQLHAQISDISSATVQVSAETSQDVEELTEAACLLQTPPSQSSRKRHLWDLAGAGGIAPKRPCLRLDFADKLDEVNDKDCDAETLPVEDLEMHVFPPTPRKWDIPPTPPLTPLKRLTSLARDRKCLPRRGGNIFVFPDKSEGI